MLQQMWLAFCTGTDFIDIGLNAVFQHGRVRVRAGIMVRGMFFGLAIHVAKQQVRPDIPCCS